MEAVHGGRPPSGGSALGWVVLGAVVVLTLIVAGAGINLEWFNGSPEDSANGGFNLTIVPVKHPVPDAGFYCEGMAWFSAPLPDPQLIAAEVNAAPNAAAHSAALKFYDDLVDGRSTASDLATVGTTSACPSGR